MEEGELTSSSEDHSASFSEYLDRACVYFMGCGLTADEFWHGDYTYFKYYEQAEKERQRRRNFFSWLDGMYIQHALAATVGNMFREKGADPIEYPSEPFAMDADERREQIARQEKAKENRQAEEFKQRMTALAAAHNAKKELRGLMNERSGNGRGNHDTEPEDKGNE